ncbi:hypothetical protein QVH35_07000 [Candidatus Nitrosotenuis chungbukensis]|uniref:hypothetical protein n=1 Tax=Candidatus Nitrosotenuis chungbukensis TaxID=1353246 RepID=UPI002673EA47|nr:hypothetical protein [Candidatus Nitrosotenuis chungbukensis]WKT57183.1 hypothetical protein QVH35_07000 [Candidatus Nitrosotenuis chungbukensis]
MQSLKVTKLIRLRDFFNRHDTEVESFFINFLEVTAFIDAERIWSFIRIDEDFLLSLEKHKAIRFGNPDNFKELPIHEISDLESIRRNWNFYRNDDEWFKSQKDNSF